ncbi:hypothetical protein [Xanthomonas arboricola]|uniref:hypothetical protein n=1 Tax=Xanthomonas arboricola TaxID=56448 RepID=UPI000E1FACD7|nr:hypothetical protein [Xanthomonas arboricola]
MSHDDSGVSPFDQFYENTLRLNKLWAAQGADFVMPPELGILLLLGYVSAVESFMRALLRRVVSIDKYSQVNCEKQQLSFGAAMHHNQKMLPEALLEETVFSGKDNIVKAVKKFIDVAVDSKDVLALLDQYDSVCELRHCCVHRFGKLGTKNAISLGLQGHRQVIEKPLNLSAGDIASIADLLITLVRSLNNFVFGSVLSRTATGVLKGGSTRGLGWTWVKSRDRALYRRYYTIFASIQPGAESMAADEMYDRFRDVFKGVR